MVLESKNTFSLLVSGDFNVTEVMNNVEPHSIDRSGMNIQ